MNTRRIKGLLNACIAVTLLTTGIGLKSAGAVPTSQRVVDFVPGEVIVKFKSSVAGLGQRNARNMGSASLNDLAHRIGVSDVAPLFAGVGPSSTNLDRIYKLILPPGTDVEATADALAKDAGVDYAEPNYTLFTLNQETMTSPQAQDAIQCDTPIYYGIQRCTDDNGQTNLLQIDLRDPRVRVQTALSQGASGECNSVNHSGKDASSNCASPYPFEKMSSFLSRYKSAGAVAAINTDYFGQDGDHGAEGLGVRNGVRLDGLAHGDTDGNSIRRSSLAFSSLLTPTIGKPITESVISPTGAYYNTVGGGPMIVQNGAALTNAACAQEGFVGVECTSPNQSAAGLTSDGRLVLMTASGKDAAGVASYLVNKFPVRSAIKFDGGGSARMAWLDANGQIKQFGASGEDRAVAEVLIVFSEKIPPPVIANDPLFPYQYGLNNTEQTGGKSDADIDATEVWGITTGLSSVMIAVIDTGVYYPHEDLNDGRVRTDIDWDYVNNDNDALDDNGHGTHVAGIIAAETNNDFGTAGVMWQASILPLKVCNDKGSCNTDNIAQAIQYAADVGARVINMSLGGGNCSQTMLDAVNYAHFDKGVVIVAAAGNDGGSVNNPAAYDPVIAVGATDKNDKIANFSSRGSKLDVVAPGVTIWSTVPKNGHDALSGTSMASPHVAGVAGLLFSQRPNLTNEQVRDILRSSTDDLGSAGFDPTYGYGRVNSFKALNTVAPANPAASAQESCPPCAAVVTANDAMSDSGVGLLGTVRNVRDTIFTSDPGRRWARIYYQHQHEVAGIVLRDSAFRSAVLSDWQTFNPVFLGLMDKDNVNASVKLTREHVEAAKRVMFGVATRGSPDVRTVITDEWNRADPDRLIGMTAQDAWALLKKENATVFQTFLPIIQR